MLNEEINIWNQNSNQITLDPLCVKKNCGKFAKSGILPIFDRFSAKRGQMLFDLNSNARFEFLLLINIY